VRDGEEGEVTLRRHVRPSSAYVAALIAVPCNDTRFGDTHSHTAACFSFHTYK